MFGGFSKGLMKASADGFHSAGVDIYGVVPESLMGTRAVHEGCTKVYETKDLDERKQVMTELGMRKEGEFKEFISFIKNENGEPVYENTLQYAILRKEWLLR